MDSISHAFISLGGLVVFLLVQCGVWKKMVWAYFWIDYVDDCLPQLSKG